MNRTAHDHHHPSAAGLTAVQQSLILAALVVSLTLGAIVWLVTHPAQSPGEQRSVEPARQQPARQQPAVAEPQRRRAPQPTVASADGRTRFANNMQQRFKRRNRAVQVEAVDDTLTLRLSWASPDEQHMISLQKAASFMSQLRSLGFNKLQMRVGEREVFAKGL